MSIVTQSGAVERSIIHSRTEKRETTSSGQLLTMETVERGPGLKFSGWLGSFLCGVCMISLCLLGFSPGTAKHIHISKWLI